jgi:Beta-lactamase/PDZ domain
VLGRVIEVVSGQSLDQFLEARLFKPLGMIDTGFYVPEAKLFRLVDPPADKWVGPPDSVLGDVTTPTKLFSGGGGLVSTAVDYLRFCQMLLNGSELDGVRILSPATIKPMTTNALPSNIRFAGYVSSLVGPLGGSTWGLGFAVRSNAAWSSVPGSVGSYSWMGASGTYFWVDPAEQLVVVQMVHVSGGGVPFQRALRNLAYGAFLVPDQRVPDAAARPSNIDADALATYAGTYRFASTSARDRQEYPEFGGLGIEVAMRNGVLNVVSPLRGMPAAKAGVLSGDVITHLNGEPTQDMGLNQAVEKMRGPVNTTVRLRIARKGQDTPIEIEIARAPIRRAGTDLQVAVKNGKLQVEVNGGLPVLDFEKGAPIAVVPVSGDEFFADGGDRTRLAFLHDEAGKTKGLVLNPGPWQIAGQRVD